MRDGFQDRESESEDDERDPRRPSTVAANMTVNTKRLPGARVGGGGRKGVGSAGSGRSSFIVVNVDTD